MLWHKAGGASQKSKKISTTAPSQLSQKRYEWAIVCLIYTQRFQLPLNYFITTILSLYEANIYTKTRRELIIVTRNAHFCAS